MLNRGFKIELCRPFPTRRDKSLLAFHGDTSYVGFHPTLIYFAPSGLFAEHEVIQRAGTPAHPDGVKYTEL